MTLRITKGRVLIIAGSDSGGGAGLQADIKTCTALGGYAMTAVTAVTVQNTQGVSDIHEVPVPIIAAQMRAVLGDLGADVIKTGMLHRSDVIKAVVGVLADDAASVPLVVDPVMVAKGGAPLLEPSAIDAVRTQLVPRATLVTPNIPEAEVLTGLSIKSEADQLRAGEALVELGAQAALIKGGHAPGGTVIDVLVSGSGAERFASPRIDTKNTHGTGCTLASAIATRLAQGAPLEIAVAEARAYVIRAIETAPGFGKGHGPLNHVHPIG
jgi:hydroxymethylpyrimidine/phosphomethylpyrimidine kinase